MRALACWRINRRRLTTPPPARPCRNTRATGGSNARPRTSSSPTRRWRPAWRERPAAVFDYQAAGRLAQVWRRPGRHRRGLSAQVVAAEDAVRSTAPVILDPHHDLICRRRRRRDACREGGRRPRPVAHRPSMYLSSARKRLSRRAARIHSSVSESVCLVSMRALIAHRLPIRHNMHSKAWSRPARLVQHLAQHAIGEGSLTSTPSQSNKTALNI
jgi:hypothetical protein